MSTLHANGEKSGATLVTSPNASTNCAPRPSHWSTKPIVDPHVIFNLADKHFRPLARSAGNLTTSTMKKVEEHEALQELGAKEVYQLGEEAKRMYQHPAGRYGIADFLKTTESGYDTNCGLWTTLADEDIDEAQLHERLTNIINTIIKHFYPLLEAGTSRTAVNSQDISLVHDNGFHFTKPGICVKATGRSFEVPERPERSAGLGYTNAATVIDMKLDNQKGKVTEQCKWSAVFLRQIFIQQPNRDFARSLFVTEKQFRLVHYDRSVVYTTPLFDIHKDAALFVQYVLGLTSPNERDLGFDTSVQWRVDAESGRKVSGTVTLGQYDEDTNSTTTLTYDLDMSEAPFVRPGIHGRGTVGWHAHDPCSGAILVKDSWHTDDKVSECEYLQAAQGIPGIVELLSFEDRRAQTADYLPLGSGYPDYHNRFKLRVVVKKYGLPVWYFRSRVELVKALRDALVAHHALFEKGIFHRDISMLNLLLGLPNAPEGYRGILIDLDMAIRTVGCKSPLPPDPYIGTRMYQSSAILRNWSSMPTPPHDYADDLASFFYVLCHIIFSFRKPGVLLEAPMKFLKYWGSDDTYYSANGKIAFSSGQLMVNLVAPYWRGACLDLLKEFQQVVGEILTDKYDLTFVMRIDDEARVKAYDAISEDHRSQFEKVKSSFDKAIAALEKEGLNAEEFEPYPEDFVTPHFKSSVRPDTSPAVVGAEPIPTDSCRSSEKTGALVGTTTAHPTGKKRLHEDDEGGIPRKRRSRKARK